jgi:hypothetical protein
MYMGNSFDIQIKQILEEILYRDKNKYKRPLSQEFFEINDYPFLFFDRIIPTSRDQIF